MMVDVARGILYIHNRDILHNDLSARNVLVSKNAEGKYLLKITDFGLSKNTQGKSSIYQGMTAIPSIQ
jgi:serine/threonine protein kinase